MATEAVPIKPSESSTKQESKVEIKPEGVAKPAPAVEAKADARPEVKGVTRPSVKSEAKAASKPEAQAEGAKAEPKPDAKAEDARAEDATAEDAKAKAEPKPAADTKASESAAKPTDIASRVGRAEAIIRRNVLWSLVAGVVPIPVVDLVAVEGIQLKMLKELSELYESELTEELAKKLVSSLVATTWSVGVGATLGYGFAKFVPVVGTALGMISTPLTAAACTRALGNVFMMHFEAGGTLLDFDPRAMRSHFKAEFAKAKEAVAKMRQERP